MSLKRKLIDSVVSGLSFSGIPALVRPFCPDDFCVLMLHGVTESSSLDGIGNAEGIHILQENLESIFQLLEDSYSVISLDEALRRVEAKDPLKGGAVVLTFDDGYQSNYELAFPLLKQYGLPATIFVVTNFVSGEEYLWWDRLEFALGTTTRSCVDLQIGNHNFHHLLHSRKDRRSAFTKLLPLLKVLPQEELFSEVTKIEQHIESSLSQADEVPAIYRPASWEQLKEMQDSHLVSIGGHTHRHRILSRCGPDMMREELALCRDLLESQLKISNPLFSYPNGHEQDHNDVSKQILQELGYRCALTTENGFNSWHADPFALRRFSTGNEPSYVDVTVSGAMNHLVQLSKTVKRLALAN